MPMISFTQRDLLRGKILQPGWYHMRIEGIGEKPSNDGGSINYPIEGTVIANADTGSTEKAGVPVDWMFNSKAIGFATGMLAALGINVAPGQRVELSALAGKDLDVWVEPDTYQNRLVNRVNHKYRAHASA